MDTLESQPASRTFIAAGLIVVLAGAVLSFINLGEQSIWLDEAYTWFFLRLNWDRVLQAVQIDAVNPPLYYLYTKALTPGALMSEAALRSPSSLAHVFGIAAAIYMGWRVGGEVGGISAGTLWAVHPLTLWASRDARPYALAAALGAAAFGAFIAVRHRRSPAATIAAILFLALGLITHYFFFVLSAALVLLTLTEIRHSPALFRRWTVITLVALVPLALWLLYYFSQTSPSLGIGWIRTPRLLDIPLTLWNLASGYAGVNDATSLVFGLIILATIGLAIFLGDWRTVAKLGGVGLLIPVVAVWIISQRRPVYMDRYFIVLMPFLAGFVAWGISLLLKAFPHSTWKWVLALLGFIAAVAAGVSVHQAGKFEKEDWRGLVAFQQSQIDGDTYSISEPEATLPLAYYGLADVNSGVAPLIPDCGAACWWIYRQPYTATHALTQFVKEPGREQSPAIPDDCSQSSGWKSPTGLSSWDVECAEDGR